MGAKRGGERRGGREGREGRRKGGRKIRYGMHTCSTYNSYKVAMDIKMLLFYIVLHRSTTHITKKLE